MCGIAGYVADRLLDPGIIDDMTDRLAHRGPDGRGVFRDPAWHLALGHRRLAIIDVQRGHQPMRSACGRYVITFNGEIYNYVELRRELEEAGCRFRTDSDTEVLLELFARRGEAACDRLNGMFAFAVADLQERTIFLARDPIGEKPLVYVQTPLGFAFASELKALLPFPGFRRRVDPVALHHFLSLNYVPGERTMMDGVRRLAPGACLTWRRGRMRRRRYYQLPSGSAGPVHADEAAEQLDHLLDDSVRLRLRSDVPVGVFLSSGVDSSLIASSVARVSGETATAYTIGFDDRRFNELPAAAETARSLGLTLRSETAAEIAPGIIDTIAWHADDPLADSSAAPVHQLCALAARHGKVALGGDGADELFGGYLTHRASAWAHRWRQLVPGAARAMIADAVRRLPTGAGKVTLRYKLQRFTERAMLDAGRDHLAFNGAWLEDEKRRLYDPDWSRQTAGRDSFRELAATIGLVGRSMTLRQLLDADLRQYLPDDILAKTDRMSMACGLEVRSPFLDRRIVAFAAGLPPELLIHHGRGKVLLRRLAANRGLRAVSRRKKQGFSVPIHAWLRGTLRPVMLDLLDPDRIAATGIFNPAAIRQRVQSHLDRRDDIGFELWGLMVFMAWHKRFIESPIMKSPSVTARESVPPPGLAVSQSAPTPDRSASHQNLGVPQ